MVRERWFRVSCRSVVIAVCRFESDAKSVRLHAVAEYGAEYSVVIDSVEVSGDIHTMVMVRETL